MDAEDSFVDLIVRIQNGDTAAEMVFFTRYEAAVRRAARVRFMHSRLRRLMDSEDVRQSVMRSFFVRLRSGDLEVRSPGELVSLLLTMTTHKVADQVRRVAAMKRGGHVEIEELGDSEERFRAADESDPELDVAHREIQQMVNDCLSPEEKQIIELRKEGFDWPAIAEQTGTTPEAVRKRHERTIKRLSSELGLDENS